MKKNKLYFLFLLASGSAIWAQDLHFSQFNANPALVNPALTGSGGLRASVSYKNQWKSVNTPFKTYGASFEMRSGSHKKKKEEADFGSKTAEVPKAFFAGGLSIYRDKAGDGKMGLTQTNLSLASFLPTGKKSFFSVGLQASLVQRKIDTDVLLFPNQYGDTGYDPGINSGENFQSQSFLYPDFAAGAQWQYSDEERGIKDHREIKAHFGFSVYHLTKPNQKYLPNGTDPLPMKYISHGDFLFSIKNSRTAIVPSYILQLQGSSMEIIAGGLFKYYLNNDTKYTGYVKRTTIGGGLYYRNADAAIIYGLLEWQEQFALGLSYDLNISKLSKASHLRGGLELTLRYTPANEYLYQK